MKRKQYFCPAAHAHFSDRCTNVPWSSLFFHNDEKAVKALAGCTDVTAFLELRHLHKPFVKYLDFSKYYIHCSLTRTTLTMKTCNLNRNFRICSRNTSGSSLIAHTKFGDRFRPTVAVQTCFDLCYLHGFTFHA